MSLGDPKSRRAGTSTRTGAPLCSTMPRMCAEIGAHPGNMIENDRARSAADVTRRSEKPTGRIEYPNGSTVVFDDAADVRRDRRPPRQYDRKRPCALGR